MSREKDCDWVIAVVAPMPARGAVSLIATRLRLAHDCGSACKKGSDSISVQILVLPGIPHHVKQRGNRRERTLFEDGDYALYLDLLADAAEWHGVEVWSYA